MNEHALNILYEYLAEESVRNENALTVAVNNFYSSRHFSRDRAQELMILLERKEYFDKVEQDIFTIIQIMKDT